MRSKEEIQKNINDLKVEKTAFTKRFETLKSNRDKLAADVEVREQAISNAIANGKDPAKEIASLTAINAELEGTDRALNLVAGLLEKLTKQQASALQGFYQEDLERLSAEVDVLLNASLKRFYAAVDSLKAIDGKFIEIDQIGALAGMRIDNENSHIRSLRTIYKYLGGDLRSTDGVPYMLRYVEQQFSRALAEMRVKKSE